MKLPQVFGEYTRSDFSSWLVTPEGEKHIEEVFAPADTDLTPQAKNDHKYGRIVWYAMQILSRPAVPEFLERIFETPHPEGDPTGKQSVSEYIRALDKPLKWKDVAVPLV